MFVAQGDVVELWATKTGTYTSTKAEEIHASVRSAAPIPKSACGNAKGFGISEYSIEPTLLDTTVFEGQPVLCKLASVVRLTQNRFDRITNTQVLLDLLAAGDKLMASTAQAPARPQAQAQTPRPAQQPQDQGRQDESPDAKA